MLHIQSGKEPFMKLIKLSAIAIALFFIVYIFYPQQQELSSDIEDINNLAPALMVEAAIPGMAVAKVENGEIVFTGVYGDADIHKDRTVTKDTLFNIASISKPIMGLVLMQLVDQNKLELDSDINNYLPFKVDNPNIENETITLRHLASHSSGIADYYDAQSYGINQDTETTLEQHLRSLIIPEGKLYNNGERFLNYAPGTKRRYSNLGAGLAGQLVEAVTGETLAEYSERHLFKQLGMTNTSWLLHDLNLDEIAVPYEVEQCIPWLFICAISEEVELNYVINEFVAPPRSYKSLIPYPHFGNPQYPDGGIRTSISQLSSFLTQVLTNRDVSGEPILSDENYNEMFKLQLAPEVSDSQRFFWRDRGGLTGHMGSDLGVATSMYFDISTQKFFRAVQTSKMGNSQFYSMFL